MEDQTGVILVAGSCRAGRCLGLGRQWTGPGPAYTSGNSSPLSSPYSASHLHSPCIQAGRVRAAAGQLAISRLPRHTDVLLHHSEQFSSGKATTVGALTVEEPRQPGLICGALFKESALRPILS